MHVLLRDLLFKIQIIAIFDHYPPPVGSFLQLSIRKSGKFLTPPAYKLPKSYLHVSLTWKKFIGIQDQSLNHILIGTVS